MCAYLACLKQWHQKLVVVLSVVCACNHADLYEDWYQLARKFTSGDDGMQNLRSGLYAALRRHGAWIASPKSYSVSSATAYECCLPCERHTHDRLYQKVATLTIGKLGKLLALGETVECWNEADLVESECLGPLQLLVLMRLLGVAHEEQWTEKSCKYAPAGFDCESLARHMQAAVDSNAALSRFSGRWPAARAAQLALEW